VKTCVIYDEDEKYGKRLFSGLLKKAQSQFNLMLFTGEQELKKYLGESVPDALLVCEECMKDWIGQAYRGNIILLTEEMCVNEETEFNGRSCVGIYRYQSLDRLYNEIVTRGNLRRSTHLKTLDIIGIYSPVCVMPRQSFALTMAKIMSEKFKTLYLNLDEFSGLAEILPSDNDYTLSDAIYFYRQNRQIESSRVEAAIKTVSGVDYIPPVVCSEDISNIRAEEMAEFMEKLGSSCGYEVIVADISSGIKQPWKLLESCRIVYTPVKDDYVAVHRMSDFENYYAGIGMGHILDRIYKVKLPEGENDMRPDFWDRVQYSGMYRFVGKMLEESSDRGGDEL
jgi:hypothetical protein